LKTVNFIFGIHNHQPVGNFDFVIEHAYRHSYLPFVEVAEDFPGIALTFHFSGCLLEWLEKAHPEYLERIAALVKRGNVEILSGGFFEPVLAVIPDADKVGQIKMMNDYIRNRFGYEAKGLWLTERVWEPSLAKPIGEAGIKYITVDDYHFLGTGKMEKDLTGHFITEEQGYGLSIFPISQKLRYAIPFKDPQETVDHLRRFVSDDGGNAIVMADDGEKFGVWPGTYETVFENSWLREFLNILQENSDWLKTQTFADYYSDHAPKGRIYLPTASYFEMSEWSLPWEAGEKFGDLVREFEHQERSDEVKPFIKGGIWRNFLFKYDESNWMQKKTQYLSDRYHRIDPESLTSAKKKALKIARNHLWRGMCNCAYWHGIFGGLYLPHLRHAIYTELLSCEAILNKIERRKAFHIEKLDIDADGSDEILVTAGNLHLAFAPHRGAMMNEFSLLDKSYNVLNSLKRYKEAYHRKVTSAGKESAGGSIHDNVMAKEAGLEKYLKYDKYPRKNLVDHFIKPEITLDQFRNGEYYEDSDFIEGKYDVEIDLKGKKLLFYRHGWVNWQKFTVQKSVRVEDGGLKIEYRLKNLGDKTDHFRFAPEFNFAMLGGETPDRYYMADNSRLKESALNSSGALTNMKSMSVVNEWDKFKLTVTAAKADEFWYFPIETVSLSEAGFERVYQSSVIVPLFDVKLKPGETRKIQLELQVDNL
jgi:alpha-amylase